MTALVVALVALTSPPEDPLDGLRVEYVRIERLIEYAATADEVATAAQALLPRVEAAFGGKHPWVSLVIDQLATGLRGQGHTDRALALLRHSLAIREKALGRDHHGTGDAALRLGSLLLERGDVKGATPLLERARTIAEAWFGWKHMKASRAWSRLADLYAAAGDYASALPTYRFVLQSRLETRPIRIRTMLAASRVLLAVDDPELAVGLLDRISSVIPEKQMLPAQRGLMYTLRGAGRRALGDLAGAGDPLEKARAILEKDAAGDPAMIDLQVELGLLDHARGESESAVQHLEAALEQIRRTLGPRHPRLGDVLEHLAAIAAARGDAKEAVALLERAIERAEQSLGPTHIHTARRLIEQARLLRGLGRTKAAIDNVGRALVGLEEHVGRLLALGGEARKRRIVEVLDSAARLAVGLHLEDAPADPRAARAALDAVLMRKARTVDAMARGLQATSEILGTRGQDRRGRRMIADIHDYTPQFMSRRNTGRVLYVRDMRLQTTRIMRRLDAMRADLGPTRAQTVAKSLPAGTVLVEYVVYGSRYAAWVLDSRDRIRHADLGPATPIDRAVAALRTALAGRADDVKERARDLHRLVLEPLESALKPTRRWLIAPDGALSLVPFAALVAADGRWVVEHATLGYVTTGRDLLRLQKPAVPGRRSLIIADPAFGKPSGGVAEAPGNSVATMVFQGLPGTGEEAKAIGALIPRAQRLLRTGTDAKRDSLIGARAPRILHIATHGFFLSDPTRPPLARAGLVLSGFNRKSDKRDLMVTGDEIAALDLVGTELATLSACETGLGVVKPGEGVFGLRRALILAGARTALMSLWQVSDLATRDLISAFYARVLRDGEGRAEALRAVQLSMLRGETLTVETGGGKRSVPFGAPEAEAATTFEGWTHPYYWAAFVNEGDPGPLAVHSRGSLEVTANHGYTIEVDGEAVPGSGTMRIDGLAPGKHRVAAVLGANHLEKEVTLEAGVVSAVSLYLRPSEQKPFLQPTAPHSERLAHGLLDRAARAHGGLRKLAALKNVRFAGHRGHSSRPDQEGPPHEHVWVPPLSGIWRTEEGGQKVVAATPDTQWRSDPDGAFDNARKGLGGSSQNERVLRRLWTHPLAVLGRHRDDGVEAVLDWPRRVDGVPCDSIRLHDRATDRMAWIALDAKTHRLRRITTQNDRSDILQLSDDRKVSGALVPHRWRWGSPKEAGHAPWPDPIVWHGPVEAWSRITPRAKAPSFEQPPNLRDKLDPMKRRGSWTHELDSDRDVTKRVWRQAQRQHGCRQELRSGDLRIARCGDMQLAIRQRGDRLHVVCNGIDRVPCRHLVDKLLEP